ncbi:hypothetical protein DFH08DRAFT_958489 [Mycena albidolilacea]|uniref:DUF5648 domain-containing protein n=1 Tax=Mycena albidolilacea TaxID=1033008 RepID=A0AAD7ETG8_9AGAR|nr:hypothetical protein DFH08DRAFT_958489 [Mycena albidolilacea]
MPSWTVILAALLMLVAVPPISAAVAMRFEDTDAAMQMRFKITQCPPVQSSRKFHRFVNPDTERAQYSLLSVLPELESDVGVDLGGFEYDGVTARVFADQAGRATVPLYHLSNPATQDSFYFTRARDLVRGDSAPGVGYVDLGVAAHVLPRRVCGAVPFFRLLRQGGPNGEGKRHFYTADVEERDQKVGDDGYVDAGIVGYVMRWN